MRRVLVWDAPNMDMALGDIFDRPPTSAERPNWSKLFKWFEARATEDEEVVACVFVNISTHRGFNPKFYRWLHLLVDEGYYFFAKAKDADGNGDIDEQMVDFIRGRMDGLIELVIASHDAARFEPVRQEVTSNGIPVVILGFTELVNGYSGLDRDSFFDLEAVPGAFAQPLPRQLNIFNLPPSGALFEPTTGRLRPVRRPAPGAPRPQPLPRLPRLEQDD